MSEENRIKVRANGPLLCTGEIEVRGEDGTLLGQGDDLALCRCGESKNKPFCDGSHREAGFEDDGLIHNLKSEELEADSGRLAITVRANAMLVAKGPMVITCEENRCAVTRNKAALCRCGHSGNKPFCDASHKACGFEG